MVVRHGRGRVTPEMCGPGREERNDWRRECHRFMWWNFECFPSPHITKRVPLTVTHPSLSPLALSLLSFPASFRSRAMPRGAVCIPLQHSLPSNSTGLGGVNVLFDPGSCCDRLLECLHGSGRTRGSHLLHIGDSLRSCSSPEAVPFGRRAGGQKNTHPAATRE